MTKPKPAPSGVDEPPRAIGDTADGPLPPRRKRSALALALVAGAGIAGMLTRDAPGQRPGADPEERRQPQAGGRGTRSLALAPDSYDAEAHTVEAILSTGAAVQRYYFVEELEISADAIDLTRVAGGICPLLDTHNQFEVGAQIGRVTSVRIEGGQLIGTLQFDQTAAGQEIEARVARGELRAISIGYRVTRWQITATDENDNETWRAVAWELLEASLVPVPADPNAVVRSAPGTPAHGTQEEEDMRRNLPGGGVAHPNANRGAAAPAQTAADTPVVVEPNGGARTEPNTPAGAGAAPVSDTRAAGGVSASRILDLCGRSASLGSEFAAELIRANETTPLTEADLLGRVNERLIADRPTIDARAGATGTESEGYRQAIEDAVMLRANPDTQLPDEPGRTRAQRLDAAREFRGMTLMELARDYLGRTGINTRGMGRLDVAGAALGMRYGALTTSDFANALGSVTSRRIRGAFDAAPQTFRPIVSTGTLPDFKPAQIIGLGDAPALLNVPENGEFKRGAITDTGMTYRLYTYGRIIAISRQAIVNDDQNLFGRIPTMFGRKAADLESDLVWGILLSNPAMADGVPLFHASHGNLAASGGPINVENVGKGRQAMRQQKSNEGGFLNIGATYLIVGPAQETAADQFVTAITANTNSAVNPFAGRLQVIVEPRITDNSWMLSADPNAFDTIELDHLLGQEELFTDTRVGFDVDGVENKARLDVGAAALDHRGFYKSPAY
ncbi:prohead protease/major capsid protein fusion protein [Sphingomonas sp. ACRSK]|uniref:prohead protease/major capsid protein fusion protein n=1 Tax=Sphingomonas sp. ACRSK TaxID=2918213 RepID=UPI001EF6CF97|nr:prohead protease/major capsid protein fusion protein [Sphingomonas sp. ACRSK]MCG7348931.1 Mu-like prophage major head subunit gpT family protein [Sphingomonas sp. ACRSK]